MFGILASAVVVLMVAIIASSYARPRFASLHEARAFGYVEDGEIVEELGDTNGPYRLKGGAVSGRNTFGKNFDFALTFNGLRTNWNRIVSSNTWYSVTIFENRRGNQFAVVRKRTE